MPGLRRNVILVGDAGQQLRMRPSGSINCVITSPPYFLLRDYDAHGQIGLEQTVELWVDKLAAVMAEVGRVLADHGTVWLNLGDSYSRHTRYGGPPKSLLLGPERLLLALSADGWIIRNKIAWAKTNPRPASVGDRLTCTWEPLYLLVRQRRYFFDLDAIRVPHRSAPGRQRRGRSAPGRWPATTPGCRGSKQLGRLAIGWARTRAMCGGCRRAATAAPTSPPSLRRWSSDPYSPAVRSVSALPAVSPGGGSGLGSLVGWPFAVSSDRAAPARRATGRGWCSIRSWGLAPWRWSPSGTAGTGWAWRSILALPSWPRRGWRRNGLGGRRHEPACSVHG
jgi:hypothetical protein